MPFGGKTPPLGPLAGKRILIAEDDFLQALDLSDAITRASGTVDRASSAKQVQDALERGKFDGVLLDFGLHDGSSINMARRLVRDRVPFIIVTGHSVAVLPFELRQAPYLAKPFSREQLIELAARHFRD